MAVNLFKTIQSVTDIFRFLNVRLYNGAVNLHKINLNRNVVLDGDSLQVQFLKYIGISNAKDFNTEKSKIKYSEFFPITDPRILKQNISEVDIPDFPTLINFLYTYNTRSQPNNVLSCINLIERETCAKLDVMDSKTIFQILFAYMFLIPGYTNQLQFYDNAMMILNNKIDTLSKEHLIQYGFYLGLCKTKKLEFSNIMRNILLVLSDKYLEDMTLDELCIITNASFKMSVKINSMAMLDYMSTTLVDGLSQNKLEVARIVTLLKSLRLSRYYNLELLESLSQFVETRINELSTTAISHILPYYADNYYVDENVLQKLMNKFLEDVDSTTLNPAIFESNNVRGKDLTRLLWGLSYLGFQMDHKTSENFENIVLEKLGKGDYRVNFEDVINTSLSFCTMNYIPKRLLRLILTDKFINHKTINSRSEERKNLLMSILSVEYNEVFEEMPQLLNYWNNIKDSHTEPMTSNRKNLQQVLNVVTQSDIGLSDIQLQCQIPFLNTAGIKAVVDNNKTVHIEVMDEGVCIKNQASKPNGIMELKLRLLRSVSKNSVIVINREDVEDKDEEHIKATLKEQLSRFLQ